MYTVSFSGATGAAGVAVFDAWQRWAPRVHRNLTAQINVYHTSMASTGLYLGAAADLKTLIAPLLALPGAQLDSLQEMSPLQAVLNLAGCSSVTDCRTQVQQTPSLQQPLYWKGKSIYVQAPLTAAGLQTLLQFMGPGFRNCCGSNFAGVLVDPYGGAIADVAADASAFPHRAAAYHVQLMVYWSDEQTDAQAAHAWIRSYRDALAAMPGAGGP